MTTEKKDWRQDMIKRLYTFIQSQHWNRFVKWTATLILALVSGLLFLMNDVEAMTLIDTMRYTVEYGPDAILAPMQRLC